MSYHFRVVEEADLPLLGKWLRAPHLRAWWGDPSDELGLIKHDLNDPKINLMMVEYQSQPFAYIQDYRVVDWPQDYFAEFPISTRAIDTFIGREDMLEKGHGRAYLRQHITALIEEGAEQIVIDPLYKNKRAIKAYEGAGFQIHSRHETDEGEICLMVYVKS